jgi:hypothetical protein
MENNEFKGMEGLEELKLSDVPAQTTEFTRVRTPLKQYAIFSAAGIGLVLLTLLLFGVFSKTPTAPNDEGMNESRETTPDTSNSRLTQPQRTTSPNWFVNPPTEDRDWCCCDSVVPFVYPEIPDLPAAPRASVTGRVERVRDVRIDGWAGSHKKWWLNEFMLSANNAFHCEETETWSSNFGIVNGRTGEIVVPLRYDSVSPFINGFFRVGHGHYWHDEDSWSNGKWGFYNARGELVVPLIYDDVSDFGDNGLAAVMSDGKWGFINTRGEVVIDFIYDGANSFSEGLAAVAVGEVSSHYNHDWFDHRQWGFINERGEVVIPLQYAWVGSFRDGVACVSENSSIGFYIDRRGRTVNIDEDEYYRRWSNPDGLYSYWCSETQWMGYANADGDTVISPMFTQAGEFGGGFAAVHAGDWETGSWGVINTRLELVLPFEYSRIESFWCSTLKSSRTVIDGFAVAATGGWCDRTSTSDFRVGIVDINGNVAVPFNYNSIFYTGTVNGRSYFWACYGENGEAGSYRIYVVRPR